MGKSIGYVSFLLVSWIILEKFSRYFVDIQTISWVLDEVRMPVLFRHILHPDTPRDNNLIERNGGCIANFITNIAITSTGGARMTELWTVEIIQSFRSGKCLTKANHFYRITSSFEIAYIRMLLIP